MQDPNAVQIQACPYNGKRCVNGKRDDFDIHPVTGEKLVCANWIALRGKHPQSEEFIDKWMCGFSAAPILAVENAQMTRFVQASVDKTANEVAKHHATFLGALHPDAQKRLLDADPQMSLENKNGSTGA
jgi:hypothetical protein